MRFTQYKGVLDLIDSVIEAIDYMKAHGSGELCAICAQSLHSVLNTVKDEDNSDELILMLNNAVDCFENDVYDSEDLVELIKSIKEVTKDLKYRLRVLFVAELGAKWDSMASVYKAFCDRDDCDVDVVLEPIFREVQYTDGSVKREVIYNDWLTPLGIKHTLYDQYNMAIIRPDMTFFSQPYESCTIPMFWPQNMARYSKIVYLPYYAVFAVKKNYPVTFDIFFNSPTEAYSWRIACQSEVLKNYYSEYASHKGDNVIACGLPKWDYLCNFTRENTPCPAQWKNKINGKKVFLWNTHFTVSASKLLENFGEFLDAFDKFNDKIALIWRPHPMTNTIVKLYCPNQYGKYQDMIDRIENSPNMVIDKNEEYKYSFVWSDALISDCSSLLLQYVLTVKPILMTIYSKKTSDEFVEARINDNEFFDYTRIPISNGTEKLNSFIESVIHDKTDWRKDIVELKNKYYNSADGNVGKRLSDILVKDFLESK